MADHVDDIRASIAARRTVELPEDLAAEAAGMVEADDTDAQDLTPEIEVGADPDDDGYTPSPPVDGEELPPEAECAGMALNDVGNGGRFRRHFGPDLLLEPKLGWHVWTGTHYALDKHQILVRRRAQQLGEMITREIPWLRLDDWQMEALGQEADLKRQAEALRQSVDEDGKITDEAQQQLDQIGSKLAAIAGYRKSLSGKRKAHHAFARSSGNKGKIDAALTEAGVHLDVRHEDLDAAPLDVNCQSGIMRFSVQEDGGFKRADVALIPHDRSHLVTRMIPANYDPDSECPLFMSFLRRVQPAAEMRRFLARWFGLSMSGIPVQAMTFFYGAGANGKSVLVDIVAKILADYAADMRIETLTGRNTNDGSKPTPDLVFLVNARMARASEPKEGDPLQDALIKQLTSGEPINVRPNYGEFFKFYPRFKLTMTGNHKPDIRSTDDGIWRRINLVPFDVQIPEAERDLDLIDKLWQERDGILRWMVSGLLDFLEGGLQVPDAIRNATQEYREDSDPIGSFLTACCICTGEDGDRIPSRELTLAFNFWLDQRGEGKWTERRVSTKLKDKAGRWRSPDNGRGFASLKSSGLMIYTGIAFDSAFAGRFRDAPRDQDGRPLGGKLAYAD